MLEREIQLQICDYLALRKHFFWRENNTPIFQNDKGNQRFRAMPKYSKRGVPDIMLVYKGQVFGIEVKRPKTYQSENQKIFEKEFTEVGGIYIVAKSLEDVIKYGL